MSTLKFQLLRGTAEKGFLESYVGASTPGIALEGFAFTAFRRSTDTYYNSGRATQKSVHATLPSGTGTYYLVFNNNFSLVSPKAIQASVTLRYMN